MTSNDFQVWNERLQIWSNLYVCKIVSNWWAPYVKRGAPDFLYPEGGFCSFLDILRIANARVDLIRQSLHYLLCFRSLRGKVQITRPCRFCICSTCVLFNLSFRFVFWVKVYFWPAGSVLVSALAFCRKKADTQIFETLSAHFRIGLGREAPG